MKTIYLSEPTAAKHLTPPACVLALGFFDGVHLGHQAVIATARKQAEARNLPLAIMTFDRHASTIFGNQDVRAVQYLTTLTSKLHEFARLGADYAYVLTFDEALAHLAPQAFVDRYLVGLNAQAVVAGADYTYGKATVANMETLPTHARGRFQVTAVPLQSLAGHKISSTSIRAALAEGNVTLARQLLGRSYTNHGYVVHGFARGRELGFPTLNLAGLSAQRVPAVGVYATRVQFKGETKWYPAMTSVGYNETFGDSHALTVEANLLDFSGDAYGKEVVIKWEQFLRPMVKFASIAELIDQLNADKQATQQALAKLDD